MFVLETTRLFKWIKIYQVHLTAIFIVVDAIAEHARSINVMTPLRVEDLLLQNSRNTRSNPYDEDKIIL